MKRIRLIAAICCAHLLAVSSFAAEPPSEGAAGEEPLVTVTPPRSYTARRILLFPFDLPSYAIRAATWPLGASLVWLDRKGVIEKIVDILSNDERTFYVYPIIEGGAGTGFGGGVGLHHTNLFHEGYDLRASYRIHIDLSQRASFSFGHPHAATLGGRNIAASFETNWQRITNDGFYGTGNATSQNNHAEFLLDDISIAGVLTHDLPAHLKLQARLGAILGNTGGPTQGSHPDVTALFVPAELAGYRRWVDYAVASISFGHDTRSDPDSPESGGLRGAGFVRYQGLNAGGYDFNEYRVDVRQYIPLWRPNQLFVARMAWTFEQPTGGGAIPFYRLAALDPSAPLRGFDRGRFRDRCSVIFNAEYRFPVWSRIDGAVFFDTGRVFHSATDFAFQNFKYSAGGGLQFRVPHFRPIKMEVGYGGEGVKFMFGIYHPI